MVSVCSADIIKIFGIDMTFDMMFDTSTEVKRPDLYIDSPKLKFQDDPVVLSCASWRIGQSGGGLWSDLGEITEVIEEDRVFGAAVRKHFLDQLVMAKLRGRKVSDWRAKLGAFLVGNHELTKAEVGMLYRLPYFYHGDQAVANVMKLTKPVPAFLRTQPSGPLVWNLYSVERVVQYRRANDTTQFWFRDEQGCPVMIAVNHTNNLHGVMDSLFDSGSISVAGRNAHWKPFYGEQDQYYVLLKTFRLSKNV
jgi:hypothetical protein